ncbi:MAG TPA: peroxidase-related enzyme [Bryobacteraceae bacterium]|nr:peroxidase-related enzyme [Bryobacteraceae bacterium]HXJ38609.1 peroxidase-related enzyme [Bryobacteraceae bacterium]
MPRIKPIETAQAGSKAKQLLDAVQAKLGVTPNMMRTMAQSPAMLEAYLNFSSALNHGLLNAKTREQLALVIGQANACEYCVAAHTLLGKGAGLSADEIQANRRADSADQKAAAGLEFARRLVNRRGAVSDDDVASVRSAGYRDGEIVEIVAHVALNTLTNYLNLVAQTEVDFPKVPLALEKSA